MLRTTRKNVITKKRQDSFQDLRPHHLVFTLSSRVLFVSGHDRKEGTKKCVRGVYAHIYARRRDA